VTAIKRRVIKNLKTWLKDAEKDLGTLLLAMINRKEENISCIFEKVVESLKDENTSGLSFGITKNAITKAIDESQNNR